MKVKDAAFLNALLSRYHRGAENPLEKWLSPEEVEQVQQHKVEVDSMQSIFQGAEEKLQRVHYSWLVEAIEKIPESLWPHLLASLPSEQAKGLCRMLERPYEPVEVSAPMKRFLLHLLYRELVEAEHIPFALLPETSLKRLLKLEKKQLVELVDYLGLHDMVQEIRKIVDKKQLERIYGALSKKQHIYLKRILQQPDKVTVPKLSLEQWGGDREKLKHTLHRRGIIRLARALSRQEPDFIWHICHTLDTNRAMLIEKYCEKEEPLGITNFLAVQVNNAIKFLLEAE